MARYRSQTAIYVGNKRYRAGQTFADTVGSAQAGDVIWNITAAIYNPFLVPLDAGAIAIKSASQYAGVNAPCTITGVQSIEA